jgi:hypothetical protein
MGIMALSSTQEAVNKLILNVTPAGVQKADLKTCQVKELFDVLNYVCL